MRTQMRLAIVLSTALVPGVAVGQHQAHQAGGAQASAEMVQCARAQLVVESISAAAMARLESARQSNSAAEMRAAVDQVEGTLRDIRAQLAPCAAAAASTDPHAGHAMADERRPASVTKLVAGGAVGGQPASTNDATAIETWLKGYDAAFNAKDLDRLATFYHPDVTIFEGGGINNGWIDYRDNHLGPELKAFENLQFGHSNTKVTVLPGGQSAYATSEYSIKAKMGEREIDSRGLETLVLVKGADGNWKIRHSHTSSRPRRPPA